jgi:hypothetical protein
MAPPRNSRGRTSIPGMSDEMNFHLSAVDDLLRHPDDQLSRGLILCRLRKRIVGEYALRDLAKPVGVARYVPRLLGKLPAKLRFPFASKPPCVWYNSVQEICEHLRVLFCQEYARDSSKRGRIAPWKS